MDKTAYYNLPAPVFPPYNMALRQRISLQNLQSHPSANSVWLSWLALLILIVPIMVIYRDVGHFDYLGFDDPTYISRNPYLAGGLTAENIHWALITRHGHFWGPVTWLSFLGEVHFFGAQPTVSHWINVSLHLCNTLLLFMILKHTTGNAWNSLCVALLFGIHPLHVESVAWVTERKDVLSTFWGLMCLFYYVQYCHQPTLLRYLSSIFLFLLANCSKPLMITLPVMMLILDYWPLQRLAKKSFKTLLIEKIPFFMGSLLFAFITIHAQESSLLTHASVPVSSTTQIAHIVADYVTYLYKTFIPLNLAVFYPRGTFPSISLLATSIALLLLITMCAVIYKQTKPYLLAGWLWYLLTLLPMSGVFVFGRNVMADRFSYVPLIGIFIITVWEINSITSIKKHIVTLSCVAIAGLTLLSIQQVRYWKNDFTLFQHALDVTTDNYLAYFNLGEAYTTAQQPEKAIPLLEEAVRLMPDYNEGYNSLGIAYDLNGQSSKAETAFRKSIALNPDFDKVYTNIGSLLTRQAKYDEAIAMLNKGLETNPDNIKTLNNLAALNILVNQYPRAIELLQRALILSPDNALIHYNLGNVYFLQKKYSRAIEELDIALASYPDNTNIRQLRVQASQKLTR